MNKREKSSIKIRKLKIDMSSRSYGEKLKELPLIEEIVLRPSVYPEFEIKQFDLCGNMDEEIELWVNVNIRLTKRDFLDFMKVVSTNFEMGGEDRIKTEFIIRLLKKETKKAIEEINPRCATKFDEEKTSSDKD